MKAVEFETCLNPDQTLTVPPALADAIPNDTKLRVLILIAENEAEREWEQLAALDFWSGLRGLGRHLCAGGAYALCPD